MVKESPEVISLETARTNLEVLRGKAAWNVGRAAGSWLSFHFGKKLVNSQGILRGEWTLYVYAPWIIHNEQEAVVSSNDKQAFIDKEILGLQGMDILDIVVSKPSFDMTLSFVNGTQFRVFPAEAEGAKSVLAWYWMFAHDAHFSIAFRPKQIIDFSDLRETDDPK